MAGTTDYPLEPIQLIRGRTTATELAKPSVTPLAMNAAIRWWSRRLDRLIAVVSDPAVHTNGDGQYLALKHVQSTATVDQVFRRTGAMQRGLRDDDSRKVLLFSCLDSLERLTGRDLLTLCTLSEARRVLNRVTAQMPGEEAQVLLPAARRASRRLCTYSPTGSKSRSTANRPPPDTSRFCATHARPWLK
jgi:hypothetical protein